MITLNKLNKVLESFPVADRSGEDNDVLKDMCPFGSYGEWYDGWNDCMEYVKEQLNEKLKEYDDNRSTDTKDENDKED